MKRRKRSRLRWRGGAPATALSIAAFGFLLSPLAAEEPVAPAGFVRDADGAPIAGAEVRLRGSAHLLATVLTKADGSFAFDPGNERAGRLVVRAFGFASAERSWSAEMPAPLVIVLERVRLREDVTVTAARGETRLDDTAARVVMIGRDELQATAAPTVDDALRQVPGFSLFRRSHSRVANPTAQGASLRGVGASGASRTLVLLDGLPLNDAFGGWVYWSRVPRAAVERVEVLEGGASDLYGSAALGGVIQARERSDAPAVSVEASGGTEGTAGLSVYAAERRGGWSLRGSGEAYTTDGYVPVSLDARGPVDTAAGSRHLTGRLMLERGWAPGATAFLRVAGFGESRTNGTPLQVNDTDWRELSAGGDLSSGAGTFSLRASYAAQTYHQTFSAVSADRTSEALTRWQRVPADAAGLGLQWSRGLGSRHALLLGVEGRWIDGRSDETAFLQGQPLAFVSAGGRDRALAVFATDRVALGSRALLTLGARLDGWAGGTRNVTELSPRGSFLFRATRQLSLTAAAYGAFRAPTHNELYRSFRVGNTVTQANPGLVPERLRGGEAGIAWRRADGRLRLRAGGFLSRIDEPIANVTLRATPQLITRERRNLGQNHSRGLEVDAEARLGSHLWGRMGYALIDATIESFPTNPGLEGNRVPQVALHQLTFGARFAHPHLLELSVQARVSSAQFEDDQNLLPLPGYFTLDLQVSRRMRRVTAFAVVENLTGQRYAVGLTPTPTVGPPRPFRVGLRFE